MSNQNKPNNIKRNSGTCKAVNGEPSQASFGIQVKGCKREYDSTQMQMLVTEGTQTHDNGTDNDADLLRSHQPVCDSYKAKSEALTGDNPLYVSTGTQANIASKIGKKHESSFQKGVVDKNGSKLTKGKKKQVRFDTSIKDGVNCDKIHKLKSRSNSETMHETTNVVSPVPPTCIVQCELYENNLLPFQVGHHTYTAILDTGADCTVMSYEFMKELQQFIKLELIKSNTPGIRAVGEFVVKAYGNCSVPITIQGLPFNINARVLKSLRPKIILGNDFIIKYKGIINISDRSAHFTVKNVPVRAVHNIKVQPMQEVSIPAQIDDNLPVGLVGELTPIFKEDHPLMGARIIGKVHENGLTAYRLCNLSEQPVNICKGQRIATFSSINEKSIGHTFKSDCVGESENKTSTFDSNERKRKQTEWFMLDVLKSIIEGQTRPQLIQNGKLKLKPIVDSDINLEGSYLSARQKQQIIDLVKNNREVFALDLSELGCAKGPPCRIHLKEGAEPVRCAPYKASPIVQEKIDADRKSVV